MYQFITKLFFSIGIRTYGMMLACLIPALIASIIITCFSKSGLMKFIFFILSAFFVLGAFAIGLHMKGITF
jgi:hypothetical protein